MKKTFRFGSFALPAAFVMVMVTALALGAWTMPASAKSLEFEISNTLEGNATVSVALSYYDTARGAWCNQGWFNVRNGEARKIKLDNIDVGKGMSYYARCMGKACVDGYTQSKEIKGWVDLNDSFKYYGSSPKNNPGGKNPQLVNWNAMANAARYPSIEINVFR